MLRNITVILISLTAILVFFSCKKKKESIEFEQEHYIIDMGETQRIDVKMISDDYYTSNFFSNGDYNTSSSDDNIVSFGFYYMVTLEIRGLHPGEATISINHKNKPMLQAKARVTVQYVDPVNIISENKMILSGCGATSVRTATSLYYNLSSVVDNEFKYSSSDEAIATVDEQSGKVTAVKNGTATITANAAMGKAVSYDVEVRGIVPRNNIDSSVMELSACGATGLRTALSDWQCNSGEAYFIYSSSNEAIATVNETTGEVTAHSDGEVVITANANIGENVFYTVKVSGTNLLNSIDTSTLYLDGCNSTGVRTASSSGDCGKPTVFRYYSDNPKIVSVNETTGELNALANGMVIINAKANKGNDVQYPVNASGIGATINSIDTSIMNLNSCNASETRVANSTDACSQPAVFYYDSSDKNVAKVNRLTGEVTAVGNGTATITARADKGDDLTYQVLVSNNSPINSIDTKEMIIMTCDRAYKRTAASKNVCGKKAEFTYQSSNAGIVSVNSKTGEVKARRVGRTVITAVASSGENVSYPVNVTHCNTLPNYNNCNDNSYKVDDVIWAGCNAGASWAEDKGSSYASCADGWRLPASSEVSALVRASGGYSSVESNAGTWDNYNEGKWFGAYSSSGVLLPVTDSNSTEGKVGIYETGSSGCLRFNKDKTNSSGYCYGDSRKRCVLN